MGRVTVDTLIQAPRALCFDLARDLDAHVATASFTGERCVPPGRLNGLLEPGEGVTFEARHLGVRQRLTARVTEFERPERFVDEQVRGAFVRLRHVHEFRPEGDVTRMRDMLEWESPFGVLGRLADRLFLERYMARFLRRKQLALKELAEARHRGEGATSAR